MGGIIMTNSDFIAEIINKSGCFLGLNDLSKLKSILEESLFNKKIILISAKDKTNEDILTLFVNAKTIEGCSLKTISYYQKTLISFFKVIDLNFKEINTDHIRNYLSSIQIQGKTSNISVDNTRRIISSFFSWLEDEDYIVKSPVRRIKRIKIGKKVKEVYSEENIEFMKQNVSNKRDLAIIDFLYSTGVRVGELIKLNISDINFEKQECIVNGKGNKERKVYFDAKTKLHLKQYLNTRTDKESALFVTLNKPNVRLKISGVEIFLRKLGIKIGIGKVHPHKFRRTLATKAIDKGMPIEQVQKMLGHTKIDTTLEYAMVDDSNVKMSHKRYLE